MNRFQRGLRTLVLTVFAALGVLLLVIVIVGTLVDRASKSSDATGKPFVPVPTYTNTPEPTPTRTPSPTSTPDTEAIYRRQIEAWLRDVLAWSDDLEAGFDTDDPGATLAALEQQALELKTKHASIHPPPHRAEMHRLFGDSLQSCIDALRFAREGESGWGEIYGETCIIGFTLLLDKLGRN